MIDSFIQRKIDWCSFVPSMIALYWVFIFLAMSRVPNNNRLEKQGNWEVLVTSVKYETQKPSPITHSLVRQQGNRFVFRLFVSVRWLAKEIICRQTTCTSGRFSWCGDVTARKSRTLADVVRGVYFRCSSQFARVLWQPQGSSVINKLVLIMKSRFCLR